MANCTNCGAPLEGQFCTNCGAAAPKSAGPAPLPQQNYQNPAPVPPPVYNNYIASNKDYATSVGGWIGWMFLLSFFPIIGHIIMLCCSNDESAKNYVKAQFVLAGIVLGIVLVIILIAMALAISASS